MFCKLFVKCYDGFVRRVCVIFVTNELVSQLNRMYETQLHIQGITRFGRARGKLVAVIGNKHKVTVRVKTSGRSHLDLDIPISNVNGFDGEPPKTMVLLKTDVESRLL
jgi:hypothetical protein